ncbi:MAG TPA: cytochrome c [Casimicrobiaceae bacterium]|nr:cytochrome c [Casimicrobiaceae bacterium]
MKSKLIPIVAALLLAGASAALAGADGARTLLGAKIAAADSPDVAVAAQRYAGAPATSLVERGRYIARTAGCNDCHTPHYPEKAGDVPEREWLTGVPVGFQGPWGTTYPANLRLMLDGMTEAQWIARARQPMRPPMPWFALRDMTDDDLRAIYAYVRSLGPAGAPAPAYAAPGASVDTPYFVFVPQNPPAKQAQAR